VRPATREPFGIIDVVVDGGVVTLDGQVPSLSHKRLAGVLAWWVPGVPDVITGLAVEPTQEDSGDEITEAVRLVLEKDRFVPADHIRVRMQGRVLTLDGGARGNTLRAIARLSCAPLPGW
jgi:osmotically-inducible protein OsmY